MDEKSVIINFNNKLVTSFLFVLVCFSAGLLASLLITEGDNRHSAFFYQFGGICFALLFFPFLVAYGKALFIDRIAFYFDDNEFIYNNPLVDNPNPILWKDIKNIKELDLGENNKFIAISFHDNEMYIKKLNIFWRYITRYRLTNFDHPLFIHVSDLVDINFEEIKNIFFEKYLNYNQ